MTRPLEKFELENILSNPYSFLNERDKALFYTQLFTGLRGSELTSLRINQVATHTRLGWKCFSTIKMDIDQMKGKKRGRVLNISDTLKKTIEEYLNEKYKPFTGREPKDEYFLSPSLKSKDKPLLCSTWNDILKDIFLRNDIVDGKGKLGTHTLRKVYVVNLYNNPLIRQDPLLLIKCTGHQRLETLQHYVSVHSEDVRDAQRNVFTDYFPREKREDERKEGREDEELKEEFERELNSLNLC